MSGELKLGPLRHYGVCRQAWSNTHGMVVTLHQHSNTYTYTTYTDTLSVFGVGFWCRPLVTAAGKP